MALTKVQKTGITDNAIDADKIEDGTIVAADIAPGTITNAKLAGSIANDKLANSSITVNGSSVSLGGSVTAGKVQWQSVKTADFNAVAGEGYFVDTNSVGAVTATLPGSPSAGDTIAFKDYATNFGTNSLTIARNGNNIQGIANDSLISTNRASIVLVYIDATKGWLYTNESNVGDLGISLFTEATGGTITTSGDYKIHTFTGDGCFTVTQLGNNPIIPTGGPNTVSYLVVAGGGSGGGSTSGGAGAGGFREGRDIAPSYTASPLVAPSGLTITQTTYPVTVGAGGAAGTPATNTSGSPSAFSTITSAGGGRGVRGNGQDGGSGSGSSGGPGGPSTPGLGNTPPTSPPQGNNGGIGQYTNCGSWRGGGGGGATVAGTNATPSAAGNGGNGATTSISGSPTTYAGGGGGAGYPLSPAAASSGGTGGGGAGGIGPAAPGNGVSGTANTGGGGGGNYNNPGASTGGKGIVIIRYKYQ
jgi:hypothetical protein